MTAGCFVDEPPFDTSATSSTAPATTTTTGTDGATDTTEAPDPGSTTAVGACGDGVVDPGEACDDGDDEAGDGCNPDCTASPAPLHVFVSKSKINGNAGTIADVDARCQAEAGDHGLPGVYFAWLSFDNTSEPAQRFVAHERAYVLPGPDTPVVAVGLAGLLDNIHERGITRGPDGVDLPPQDGCTLESLVWTGTANDGTVHPDNCMGFTSADLSVKGRAGRYTGNGNGWSSNCAFECDKSLPFYCFEQPEP